MPQPSTKPPWVDDKHPDRWVLLPEAARTFRKSQDTIRRLASEGTLKSYFDGGRWWIRLDFSTSQPTE